MVTQMFNRPQNHFSAVGKEAFATLWTNTIQLSIPYKIVSVLGREQSWDMDIVFYCILLYCILLSNRKSRKLIQ